MQYHPDRNSWDKDAEQKFKEINEAYSVLSNDWKRKQYDTFWSTWWAAGWNPFWWGFNWSSVDVDLWDIFESFFWGGFSWWNTRKRKTEFPWEDLEYSINVDLKTSIYWWKEKYHSIRKKIVLLVTEIDEVVKKHVLNVLVHEKLLIHLKVCFEWYNKL